MSLANKLLENNVVPDWAVRAGIRNQLRQRLLQEDEKSPELQLKRKMEFIEDLNESQVAIETDKANEQHYQLPTQFFQLCLGKRFKYSSCYFEKPDDSLDTAEESMLMLYCQRAGLKDGMTVLDLGCGWGSLTLYLAKYYPGCKIISLSNSRTQREHIQNQCKANGFQNVKVETQDIKLWETAASQFDRIFSIEMFEHMKNYGVLFEKVSSWLKPQGRLFIHVFVHKEFAYHFESEGDDNWMGKYFFTGGTMPSNDLFLYFQKHLHLINHWIVNGKHYAQTSEKWLENMDNNIELIRPILKTTYGEDQAVKWEAYWRTFYMSCAELFGYNDGNEWFVSHYLFEKK